MSYSLEIYGEFVYATQADLDSALAGADAGIAEAMAAYGASYLLRKHLKVDGLKVSIKMAGMAPASQADLAQSIVDALAEHACDGSVVLEDEETRYRLKARKTGAVKPSE